MSLITADRRRGAAPAAVRGRPRWAPRVRGRRWLQVLLTLLGATQQLMAASTSPVTTLLPGVAGGLLVVAVAWTGLARWPAVLLVALATVPFAVLTWTAVVPPLVAVLACTLAAGLPARREHRDHAGPLPMTPPV